MTPWVRGLLVANVVVFLLAQTNPVLRNHLAFIPVLGLVRPWTAITYMFVHAPGFMHIGFNMLTLFFFGPKVEERMGGRRFALLYLISGVSGAVLSAAFAPRAPIIGASAAVFGVLLAFATYWPDAMLFIMGIIPMRARTMVVVLTAGSLYMGLGKLQTGIAHFAHLGGFVGAWLYLRWTAAFSPSKRFRKKLYGKVAPHPLRDAERVQRWKRVDRSRLHEINRSEFQRLLDKIDREGVGALTLEEREFLDRFS